MKTAVLKIKRFSFPISKLIITILGFAVLITSVFYMYFLTMSVVNVVLREEAVQTTRWFEVEITALETEFMLAQQAVSVAIVANQQYTETNDKIFVNRVDTKTVAISRE